MATTTEPDPFAAVSEQVREALARLHQARQTGDELLIEAAVSGLEAAKTAMDAALDQFEENVLHGHFRRKRDLPPAGHVLLFKKRVNHHG